ncbi:MAG: cytochrome c biogenesis CcdA family protein [Candidatus Omnitrophota bacterium]
MQEQIQIVSAFGAGVLTFFSPCLLPLVPVYLSFITGLSAEELISRQPDTTGKRKLILTEAVLFILGFSFVFVALGASAGFLASFFTAYKKIIRIIGAIILILFGLNIAGFLNWRFLEQEKRLRLKSKPLSLLGSLFVGMAFGLGWTPCVGPILGGVLVMAATRQTMAQGAILLSAYSLGLGIPLFLVSIGINKALGLFTKIKQHFTLIKRLSALVLIILGISILIF